jgi:hypothetical protein
MPQDDMSTTPAVQCARLAQLTKRGYINTVQKLPFIPPVPIETEAAYCFHMRQTNAR